MWFFVRFGFAEIKSLWILEEKVREAKKSSLLGRLTWVGKISHKREGGEGEALLAVRKVVLYARKCCVGSVYRS